MCVDEKMDQLNQLHRFHAEMQATAEHYKHRCAEQMRKQMEQTLQRRRKPRTLTQDFYLLVRRWLSQQLWSLARAIDPLTGETVRQGKTPIDPTCWIIEPNKSNGERCKAAEDIE